MKIWNARGADPAFKGPGANGFRQLSRAQHRAGTLVNRGEPHRPCLICRILSALHPLLMPAVAVPAIASFFALKYTADWRYRNHDRWKDAERKIDYMNQVSSDFTRAKDIRLYGMSDWLEAVLRGAMGERLQWSKRGAKDRIRRGRRQRRAHVPARGRHLRRARLPGPCKRARRSGSLSFILASSPDFPPGCAAS